MESRELQKLFENDKYISAESVDYENAIKELKEKGIKEIHVGKLIDIIKNSGKFNLFKENIDFGNNRKWLYPSDMHGAAHNERVAMFAFSMGVLSGLSDEEQKIIIEAAKYHDIGRRNDEDDDEHGRRSAEKLDKYNIEEDLMGESRNILKAICIGHSIDDKDFGNIMKELEIKDKNKCQKLFEILKDADALDRARFSGPCIDTNYLRTKYSEMMIPAAYELYENY